MRPILPCLALAVLACADRAPGSGRGDTAAALDTVSGPPRAHGSGDTASVVLQGRLIDFAHGGMLLGDDSLSVDATRLPPLLVTSERTVILAADGHRLERVDLLIADAPRVTVWAEPPVTDTSRTIVARKIQVRP